MLSKQELLDLQFIDARHKLIDIAAFLDRIERHSGETDYRFEAFQKALPILLSASPHRARAVLEALSDKFSEIPETAVFQGAFGAPFPNSHISTLNSQLPE